MDPDKQWKACVELGKISDQTRRSDIVRALISQLKNPNCSIVKAHAVEALGNLSAKEAIEEINKTLKANHHLTRAYSADALAKIKDENSVDYLIERAETDPHYGVRAAAINSLKKICEESNSQVCVRAKAVLWDTPKREEKMKDSEEHKSRVKREGIGTQPVG